MKLLGAYEDDDELTIYKSRNFMKLLGIRMMRESHSDLQE